MNRIPLALLILRLACAAFLIVWASLKFLRPEWMVNVFKGTYGIASASPDWAYGVGVVQMALVILFTVGLFRRFTYPAVAIMHGTGIVGALLTGNALFKGGILNAVSTGTYEIGYTQFPANLLWTSVATLGALVALWLMWREDRYTIDGLRARRAYA